MQVAVGPRSGVIQPVVDDRGDLPLVAAVGLPLDEGGDGEDLPDGVAGVRDLLPHLVGEQLVKAHQHLVNGVQRAVGGVEGVGVRIEVALQPAGAAQGDVLEEGEGVVVL